MRFRGLAPSAMAAVATIVPTSRTAAAAFVSRVGGAATTRSGLARPRRSPPRPPAGSRRALGSSAADAASSPSRRGAEPPVPPNRRYFLLKSEPSEYSISSLRDAVEDEWDGVRNYEARNNLRSMNEGDMCLFYHSSCRPPLGPGVAGTCAVAGTARPDETQFDPGHPGYDPKSSRENPRWDAVTVRFDSELGEVLTLRELKEEAARNPDGAVAGMDVLRRRRLSVTEVTAEQWTAVGEMIEAKDKKRRGGEEDE